MDPSEPTGSPPAVDVETIRLQAEEHPLIEDAPPASAAEHGLRLVHLRAYDEAVAHAAGRDVLDVGCNTGYGTVRFLPVARRVVGVDVSPGAIDAARRRASDGRPEFVLTSGFDLPFPDDSFDLVSSFQVLEHVPDPLVYLREIARVTRPGGEVILATPNAAIRLDPGMTPWNRFHVHEYLAAELREVLAQVFPQVRVRGLFGTPTLYETEIRRVDAARQRIRRKNEAARLAEERGAAAAKPASPVTPSRAARPPRPWPIRVARRVLPPAVRGRLRSALASAPASRPGPPSAPPRPQAAPPGVSPPEMSLDAFLEFSVADLFYADTDLDRAMDSSRSAALARKPGRPDRGEARLVRAMLCDRSRPRFETARFEAAGFEAARSGASARPRSRGDVAQLEEHRVRIAGVRGSSPLISTTRLPRARTGRTDSRRAMDRRRSGRPRDSPQVARPGPMLRPAARLPSCRATRTGAPVSSQNGHVANS